MSEPAVPEFYEKAKEIYKLWKKEDQAGIINVSRHGYK